MKKHNLSKFFRSKSFYVLLSVGVLAILVISMVGVNQTSNNDRNEQAKVNEPISEIVDEDKTNEEIEPDDNNKPSSSATNNNDGSEEMEESENEADDEQDDSTLESDVYEEPSNIEDSEETEQTIEIQEVMNPTTLYFNHDSDKLLWPVQGNVIRKYSMDSLIHYATLEQWKVSDAMLISAKEGEDVTCAADGIITSIKESEETGITVTSSIGDGYNLIYGQIENLKVGEGDSIEKGQIIGNVAKPTRYNFVEGPSLYFKLKSGDETLDPMVCLD